MRFPCISKSWYYKYCSHVFTLIRVGHNYNFFSLQLIYFRFYFVFGPFSVQSRIPPYLIYTLYISRDFHSFILSILHSDTLLLVPFGLSLFPFLLNLFLFRLKREQPSHLACVFFYTLCLFLPNLSLKKTQPLFLLALSVRAHSYIYTDLHTKSNNIFRHCCL